MNTGAFMRLSAVGNHPGSHCWRIDVTNTRTAPPSVGNKGALGLFR